MNARSQMSTPPICSASQPVTSSPAWGDGLTHSVSPDGPTTGRSGPAHARVNRSAQPESEKASPTNDTSGRSSATSSASDVLQSFLESRLRPRLNGSDLCEVIWKPWNTPWGQCLFRPRARVRSIHAKDFSLWQTPRARGDAGGRRWRDGDARNLEDQARMFALLRGLSEQETALLSMSPMFCGRLMGYPPEWLNCAPSATPSTRARQSSSLLRQMMQ